MRRSNIIKTAICLIALLMPALTVTGSTIDDDVKLAIRNIKLDQNYIYGEASHESHDIAYNNALSDLLSSVNEIRLQKGLEALSNSDLIGRVSEYEYNRNDVNLSFAFITVTDALSIQHKQKQYIVANSSNSAANNSAANNSAASNSATSNNAANNSAANNSAASNSAASNSQSATVNHAATNHTSNDSAEPSKTNSNVPISDNATSSDPYRYITLNVLEREMFSNAWQYLSDCKTKGEISYLIKEKDRNQIPADAYVLIVGHDYSIMAFLSPNKQGNRINLKTKSYDDLSNYKNVAIIWYK